MIMMIIKKKRRGLRNLMIYLYTFFFRCIKGGHTATIPLLFPYTHTHAQKNKIKTHVSKNKKDCLAVSLNGLPPPSSSSSSSYSYSTTSFPPREEKKEGKRKVFSYSLKKKKPYYKQNRFFSFVLKKKK